jgi:16S rRNA (adenine1518-N6/adenine1519-N6)-dimethyltransferase
VKHQPRKRFGQHFLTDTGVLDAIVDAIDPKPGQALIEIGPGLGALTLPLLERCQRLTVIELDRDLAARLSKNTALDVIEADVLTVDFKAIAAQRETKLRVVGNLPYNISTPILFHLLDAAARIEDQHFMLQKEVVQRMGAGPGTKDYGRLSVMLQWRYHIESVLDVPPEAFEPSPRVDSAVVRMLPWPRPADVDRATFEALVASAFSQRRKLLRHSLGRWLEERGFEGEFDLQRRGEEVPVAEYVALAIQVTPPSAPENPG